MSQWTNRPPTRSAVPSLDLLRTHATKSKRTTIISSDICGCETHYHKGRTVLCKSNGCQPCLENEKPRWYGYLAVWRGAGKTNAIFEFPEGAYESVAAYKEKYKTLRGAQIECYRKPSRANGRVILTLSPSNCNLAELPEEFDVQQVLCKIWHVVPEFMDLDKPKLAETLDERFEREDNNALALSKLNSRSLGLETDR